MGRSWWVFARWQSSCSFVSSVLLVWNIVITKSHTLWWRTKFTVFFAVITTSSILVCGAEFFISDLRSGSHSLLLIISRSLMKILKKIRDMEERLMHASLLRKCCCIDYSEAILWKLKLYSSTPFKKDRLVRSYSIISFKTLNLAPMEFQNNLLQPWYEICPRILKPYLVDGSK